MEQRKLDVWLFKIMFLAVMGVVVTQTLGMSGLTSTLFLLTFPLTVLLWLRCVRQTLTGLDFLMLLTVGVALVGVLISASATGASPSFSYLKKLIMFVMTLMFFQTAYRMKIQADIIRFINVAVDLLTLYLIFLFFTQPVRMYMMGNRVSAYLTFRFSNPNLTGLFLTCLYMLELYRVFTPEKWYWKALHIALSVFLAVFLVLTQARNALLIAVLFTAACMWLMLRSQNKLCIGKVWAALIATFPILFVAIYMALIYAPWIQDIFSFMVGEGKGLDSRMEVWQPGIEQLFQSPVFGAYSQISGGTGSSQMHNTHLDIACSYGIPVLILVCVLLWHYLNQSDRIYTNKGNYIYILCFACAILLGMGEAALFSGGLGLYIFVGSFLMMAGSKAEESEERLE